MGRLSFDPKRMWRDDDAQDNGILGTEDLKLYAEGAALGLKDYPANESRNNPGYEDIMERVPVMVGFNVPAFRVLDVLSVEVQWFGSRAPNSYNRVMFSTTLPQAASGSTPEQYVRDDIKWSVYARKTLFGFCTLTGQIASDHLRTEKVGLEHIDTEENLRDPRNRHWRVKMAFAF